MTITLTPKTEELLLQRAKQEGVDANWIADGILSAVLEWELQEQLEMTEVIRRGLEASDSGRVRSFADFAAHMRIKHSLPIHLSDSEIGITR